MEAVKIVMRENSQNSNNPKDIDSIILLENGSNTEYSVEQIYDLLMTDSKIKIYIHNSQSYLIPIIATNGIKYIRSTPNKTMIDELMKLPRC